MSLISSAALSNVTVYREEFTKKTAGRPPPSFVFQDYTDPLAGSSENHVLPYCKLKQITTPHDYPDPKKYVEEICNKHVSARVYLQDPPYGPPDFDIIDRLYDDDNRTVYMTSYCKLGDFESKASQGMKRRALPPNWFIPETTQRCSYRHPRIMAPEGFKSIKLKPPPENLRPNLKERAVLQTKTGDSDYMGTIGRVGQEIIDGKLHGDINVRPQFDQEELLKAKLIRRS